MGIEPLIEVQNLCNRLKLGCTVMHSRNLQLADHRHRLAPLGNGKVHPLPLERAHSHENAPTRRSAHLRPVARSGNGGDV